MEEETPTKMINQKIEIDENNNISFPDDLKTFIITERNCILNILNSLDNDEVFELFDKTYDKINDYIENNITEDPMDNDDNKKVYLDKKKEEIDRYLLRPSN